MKVTIKINGVEHKLTRYYGPHRCELCSLKSICYKVGDDAGLCMYFQNTEHDGKTGSHFEQLTYLL